MARIVLKHEIDAYGNKVGEHVIHTERAPWNTISNAATGNVPMDLIDWVKALRSGAIPIAGTGWDQPSNHPAHPGATMIQVLVLEIVRVNDGAARAALGV